MILLSCVLFRSGEKWEPTYLHFNKVSGHQTSEIDYKNWLKIGVIFIWETLIVVLNFSMTECRFVTTFNFFFSLRLQGEETLKHRCVCWSLPRKVYYRKYRPWAHAKLQFFSFRPEIPILSKFGSKIQNCQFKILRLP